jgi:hypothetical protein
MLGEFLLTSGQGSKAELGLSRAAGRRVDTEHCQAVILELFPHQRWRMIVGKLQFDGTKTCRGRGAEPLEERPFGEKIGEIRGKARHAKYPDVLCLQRTTVFPRLQSS